MHKYSDSIGINKVLLVLTVLTFIAGCSASKTLSPGEPDVVRARTTFPDLTLEELNLGKGLYESKCNTCHKLVKPAKKSVEEWNQIIPVMVKKANKKEVKIDASQQELITRYLVTMSESGKK